MANMNPLAGAYTADTRMPQSEQHASSLNTPTEKQKRAHAARAPVEMPRANGLRKSAAGRDLHKAPGAKLPGLREPKAPQRVAKGSSPKRGR